MWPWDHLAVAYLCYSAGERLRGRTPADGPVLALALGSQFPDLVDKPLSWTLAAVPVLTHALVVALPLSALLLLLGRRYGRAPHASAFVLGYLLHLVGDLLYPLATDGVLGHRRLLWPFLPYSGNPGAGLLATTVRLFNSYLEFLATSGALWYVAADLLVLLAALALWRADGTPAARTVRSLWRGR